MATASLQLCDFCEKPLEGRHPRWGRMKGNSKQGLVVTVGYSDGGWGYRKNHIDFSGEVCQDCYATVMEDVKQLSRTIANLKGSKRDNKLSLPSFR